YAIRSFRSFCSWGGDVEDYRMLGPYLSNRFIMAKVIRSMVGVEDIYWDDQKTVITVPNSPTAQLVCDELICRRVSPVEFQSKFPKSIGSTGLYEDLTKLYCGHFRYQSYSSNTSVPQV